MEKENKIKKLRQELGWSQRKLADFLGCNVRIVQSWDAEYTNNYPTEWVEKLIIEKLAIELLKK